ncbi:MAG: hypothetical protein D6753_07665 [Planctomycetota bacterium]|nr:MAG: hypothetical protein D6753_07665 [Planctomycetota bacterium]
MHERDLAAPQDQAQKLRQLAQSDTADAPRPATAAVGPHCILLAEFPAQGRTAPLAWFLAQELLRRLSKVTIGGRGLLVDLAPAASRLRELVDQLQAGGFEAAPPPLQPLWEETAHGRVLRKWEPQGGRWLDVVAQTDSVLPSPVQYQRINEQLIRHLASRGQWHQPRYDVTVLCAGGDGIPLDGACWQAADDILVLWSPELCGADQLQAQLQARMPGLASTQRTSWVCPVPSGVWRWMGQRRRAPAAAARSAAAEGEPASVQLGWHAHWNLPLAAWPTSAMHLRQYRRAARRIAARLSKLALRELLPRRAS